MGSVPQLEMIIRHGQSIRLCTMKCLLEKNPEIFTPNLNDCEMFILNVKRYRFLPGDKNFKFLVNKGFILPLKNSIGPLNYRVSFCMLH